jgi:hypothetical protein
MKKNNQYIATFCLLLGCSQFDGEAAMLEEPIGEVPNALSQSDYLSQLGFDPTEAQTSREQAKQNWDNAVQAVKDAKDVLAQSVKDAKDVLAQAENDEKQAKKAFDEAQRAALADDKKHVQEIEKFIQEQINNLQNQEKQLKETENTVEKQTMEDAKDVIQNSKELNKEQLKSIKEEEAKLKNLLGQFKRGPQAPTNQTNNSATYQKNDLNGNRSSLKRQRVNAVINKSSVTPPPINSVDIKENKKDGIDRFFNTIEKIEDNIGTVEDKMDNQTGSRNDTVNLRQQSIKTYTDNLSIIDRSFYT